MRTTNVRRTIMRHALCIKTFPVHKYVWRCANIDRRI